MSRKSSFLFMVCALLCAALQAQQVTIDNTYTPTQLIENVLVEGCVQVSNVSSPINGTANGLSSYAFFDRAGSDFPFQNGIILSTGNVLSAGTPEITDPLNEGTGAWGNDIDLENALGISNTLNATSIEFDFISTSNFIQFNYILASEEYSGTFPCQYSDSFAFLIRPNGSSAPYTNIAVIPGTNTPVNTNTIHEEIVGFCDASNEEYFEGYSLGDTNYNGRTTVMTAATSVVPNQSYHIKLIIADQSDQNFDSAIFIEGSSFDVSVDLGNDISTCAEQVTLDADMGNPQAVYDWFFNGNPIAGGATLVASNSGTYSVTVTVPLNNTTCSVSDDIEVTLTSEQTITGITDYELCDDISEDGVETFDLTTKTTEIVAALPNATYNVSYHTTATNAQNNTNPILTPINNSSNPQTIYFRVEDVDTGCLAFSNFNLVVNPLPQIQAPTPLEACADASNLTAEFDLTTKDAEITNGQANLSVSYHESQTDADSGIDPIVSPFTNNGTPDTVYVRVIDTNTGCVNTTTLTLIVNPNPEVTLTTTIIDACDADHDGSATFNLDAFLSEITSTPSNVNITFHETEDDANNDVNAIVDTANYQNTTPNEQPIYIRIEDPTTGCFTVVTIVLHTNALLTATQIINFYACDDESNDGISGFDLSLIAQQIVNNVNGVGVEFYLNQTDQQNSTNAIDQTVTFFNVTNPQPLYITLTSPACSESAEINLFVNEYVSIVDVTELDYCDTDDDGFTSVDLSVFDNQFSGGNPDLQITYFETNDDALNNTNPITLPYNNITTPQIIYVRGQSISNGCYDTTSFNLNVRPAPTTSVPTPLVRCDDDQDGFFVVDLVAKIPEIVSSTTGITIDFFESVDDANNDVNVITTPASYNAQTSTITARVRFDSTGCYALVSQEVIVNTLPIINAIDELQLCESDGDGFEDFIFSTKDAEILNGQPGKEVLYFLTAQDAIDRTNIVDKNAPYTNVSNPQTIHVRVENTTDINCFDTSSFIILVRDLPVYNAPTDIFVCDDVSNDQMDTFDLDLKVQEVTNGITDNLTVTFHLTSLDADNSANPVSGMFTNTVNPQTIYTRIQNDDGCHLVETFELNIIQAPEVNSPAPIQVCDTNLDGSVIHDLTIREIEILNIRQDDIVFSYHTDPTEAETGANPIPDPMNFPNTSNPQTVYINVTNTLSNCGVVLELDLIVDLPPAFTALSNPNVCETQEGDTVILTELDALLVADMTDVSISYHLSNNDAQNDQNALPATYTYPANSIAVFARIADTNTGCFAVTNFNLTINDNPEPNTPGPLGTCDDDDDGTASFDLRDINPQILNGQNAGTHDITFYISEADADAGSNAINPELIAADQQTFFFRIENNQTGCYDTGSFITLVHPLPVADIPDQLPLCDELGNLTVSADTGNPNDTYFWSTGDTNPETVIAAIGDYSVTITTEFGCQTTKNFSVIQSAQAEIVFSTTVDFSDNNSITVEIQGIGDYLFQLDDGPPQESNVFEDVTMGPHLVTVIDLNGCTPETREVIVMDYPKFFTPNGDGYNDVWQIAGISTMPQSKIYIFDRFGKLLQAMDAFSPGWDGQFNSRQLPATDYWFLAEIKSDTQSFEVRGHFSLKR